MRFETFVALRYLRGKRKNRFISLITIISVAGVSVGVMALIIVLGVMSGFKNALRETIIGNRAHFTIVYPLGQSIRDYGSLIEEVEAARPDIIASSPVIQMAAFGVPKTSYRLINGGAPLSIVGVDPELEAKVTDLAANLTGAGGRTAGAGDLPTEFNQIVLGYGLADTLGLRIGGKLKVFTFTSKPKIGPYGPNHIKEATLTVSGISEARMSEFDTLYGWVNLDTAKALSGLDGVQGIHCRIEDAFAASAFKEDLEQKLPISVTTWYENQLAFFEALRQEKLAMFIILVFIVLVAAFNITSTLIMMVMEKQRDIGILRTIGTSGGIILRLFMVEGLIIGLTGTFVGVVLGSLLAYNINPVAEAIGSFFGVDVFNSQIYYFDRIPMDVIVTDILLITLCAIALSFLSTLYPAWSASRLDPVDALRYE